MGLLRRFWYWLRSGTIRLECPYCQAEVEALYTPDIDRIYCVACGEPILIADTILVLEY